MKIIGIDNEKKKRKEFNRKKIVITMLICIISIILFILFCFYMGNKFFRDFMDKYVLMKNVVENNVAAISLEESENYTVYAYDRSKYIGRI